MLQSVPMIDHLHTRHAESLESAIENRTAGNQPPRLLGQDGTGPYQPYIGSKELSFRGKCFSHDTMDRGGERRAGSTDAAGTG